MNQRKEQLSSSDPQQRDLHTIKRRVSVLTGFPDDRFEAVVVQWESFRPSVFLQLRTDPYEPIQFPGKRPHIPGNLEMPLDRPFALDYPLQDFVDPTTGLIFGREAFNADLLFSMRAFNLIQPEPDLVLPAEAMWECRTEALNGIGVPDEPGIP